MKELKLRLPKILYEEFFRLFPGRGDRQVILRRLLIVLIERCKADKDFFSDIIDKFLSEED